MKKLRRILAALLCSGMMVSSFSSGMIWAEETNVSGFSVEKVSSVSNENLKAEEGISEYAYPVNGADNVQLNVDATGNGTVLAFTSDVHNMSKNEGADRLSSWIDMIIGKYGKIDQMGFCGDMADSAVTEQLYWTYAQKVIDVIDEKGINACYTTGNHEFNPGKFSSTTNPVKDNFIVGGEGGQGDDYYIYCLGTESITNGDIYTANQAENLLNNLNSLDNDRLIIVITHFPLHSYAGSGGNRPRQTQNANLIIDALNKVVTNETADPSDDKTVVLLWGHNHTLSDSHYDEIYAPGNTLTYNTSGSSMETKFYYAAAGCMSGIEYSPGSNNIKGKGLIITIGENNQPYFAYYDVDGNDVTEGINYPPVPVSVTGVSLDKSEVTVETKRTVRLNATVTPDDASDKEVLWSSSDETVATVTSSGTVKGISEGTAVITVTTADGGYTASSTVNVIPRESDYTGYIISISGYALSTELTGDQYVNTSGNRTYRYNGLSGVPYADGDPRDDTITWIITENENGSGYYIQSMDGRYLNATYQTNETGGNTGVLKLDDTLDIWTLDGDGTLDSWIVSGSMLKSSNADKSLTHEEVSNNREINLFTVRSNGESTELTEVSLIPVAVTGITLDKESETVEVGKSVQLKATVLPSNASNRKVRWTSDDESVATVSSSGLVTGIAEGVSLITAVTEDGGFIASCTVNVLPKEPVTTGYIITIGGYALSTELTGDQYINTSGNRTYRYHGLSGVPYTEGDPRDDTVTWIITESESGTGYYIQSMDGRYLNATYGQNETGGNTGTLKLDDTPDIWTLDGDGTLDSWIVSGSKLKSSNADKSLTHEEVSNNNPINLFTVRSNGESSEVTEVSLIPVDVTGVVLDKHSAEMDIGRTVQLQADVQPSDASNKAVVWTSSDETVAAVSDTGFVTGISAGTAVIRVTSADNEEIYDECVVTVNEHTEEVVPGVSPTCTETGLTDGKICSVCGEILEEQEVIPALGHDLISHEGKDATCTTGGWKPYETCSRCDYTTYEEIPPLGHTGAEPEAENTVEPTCTENGSYDSVVYCSVCGEELSREKVTVDALGHDYIEHEGKPASCTESGWKPYQTCSRCDFTSFEELPALGHTSADAVEENRVDPTCTEAGSYESVVYCSVCGEELSRESVTIPAAGHTEVTDAAKEATCTETGLTEGKHCSVCGEIFKAQEIIPAKGHTEETVAAVEATCTESGLEEGKICSVCGEILEDQKVIPALGHDLISHEGKAATCTEGGWKPYETCSRCDHTTYEEIPAPGHTAAEAIEENLVEPTCTEAGSFDSVVYCSVCGEELSREKVKVDALGHDLVDHDGKDATCTEPGWKPYQTCTRCNHTTYELIPALGHTAAAAVEENRVEPTCTEAGSFDSVVYCSVCGEELRRETTAIPALGHDLVDHEGQEPTCTEHGWTPYQTCERCGHTTYEEIPALGHDLEDHEAKAPTCTETGWKAYQTCSRCDHTTYEEIPALGHDLVDHEGQEPTCTEKGWKPYQTCSRCDHTTYEELPALGHTAAAAVEENRVEPTCTEAGSYDSVVYCSVCGKELSRETAVLPALGHDLVDHEGQEPTCTEKGWKPYQTCSRCGYTTYEEIPATGHTEETVAAVEPTCTQPGLVEGKRCSVCGEILEAQEVIPALGHDLVEHDGKDATCTEKGWKPYQTCTRCDHTTYEEIPALGHDLVDHEAKAPTCTEPGWKAYQTCSRCDHTTYEEIPALGHDLVDHEGQEPTCTEKGWKPYQTCSRCDYTTYEEIPAFGHTEAAAVEENRIEPTCTDTGSFESVVYCSVCGEELRRETTVIPALGHDLIDHEGQEPACTEKGWKAYQTCSRCDHTTYEEIPALGHDLVDHEGQEPTCTEKGWKPYQTCTRCDHTTYEELPAKGHIAANSIVENLIEATCTDAGSYDRVTYCFVCNEELSRETITVPALGHDIVDHEAKAPTCTEFGWDAYQTCKRCDYTTYHELPAHGHTEETVAAIEPTCTEPGLVEGKRCSVCGQILEAQEVIPALGHDLVDHEAKAPTCTEIGWDAYQTCTRCDHTTYHELPASGHNPAAAVEENRIEPTCTEDGKYDSVVYCSVCNEELNRETIEIPALGHDLVDHEGQEPTCTEKGWKPYQTCTRGDYTTYEEIPALGHIEAAAVEENRVEPTCMEAGRYDSVVYCSVCDEELRRETIIIPALGHDLVDHEGQEPTCTEKGWKPYQTCTRGDYTTYEEIPALGHTAETVAAVEPTCTKPGLVEGKICSVCGEILEAQEVIPALGHDLVDHEGKDATCTEKGWKPYQTCTRCEHSTYEKIPALGHDLVDHEGKDATCTEKGWKPYQTCTRCDHTTYEEIPALGHTEEAAVEENRVEPTCTEAGRYDSVVYCSVCDEELSRETIVIPALGHDLIEHEGQEPTCTEKGWKPYQTCTRCDHTTYEELPAKGHIAADSVVENRIEATCTEAGSYDRVTYCSVCNEELSRETIVLAAKGHNLEHIAAKEASCETAGNIEHWKCTACGKLFEDEACEHELTEVATVIGASGHSWDSGTVTKEATCTEDGVKTFTCSRCGTHRTEAIRALGHNWDTGVVTKEPTYTAEGIKTYTCSRCGETKTESIPAKAMVSTPVISTVTNTGTGLQVTWNKVEGAAKYRLYRKTESGSWAKLTDTTSTTYTDKTVQTGITYAYRLRCIDSDGAVCSKYSAAKSLKFMAVPVISKAANTADGVSLTWKKVTGAVRYRVYKKTGTGSWKKLTDTDTLTYTDKAVTSGTVYSYRLRALNSSGAISSSYSEVKNITFVTAAKLTDRVNVISGIRITWTNVTGAAKYQVYRKSGSNSWTLIGTTTKVSYTDKNVQNGVQYRYRVRSVAADNSVSVYSNAEYRTCVGRPAISGLTNSAAGKMTVKWSKIAKASGYQIQYSTSSAFASGNKTVLVTGETAVSKVIASLTKGKTYYVRVRAYRIVTDAKVWSAWSGKETVKIKK